MVQFGGFLDILLRPLLKSALPLTAIVLKTLVKSVLVPLELKVTASAADV